MQERERESLKSKGKLVISHGQMGPIGLIIAYRPNRPKPFRPDSLQRGPAYLREPNLLNDSRFNWQAKVANQIYEIGFTARIKIVFANFCDFRVNFRKFFNIIF